MAECFFFQKVKGLFPNFDKEKRPLTCSTTSSMKTTFAAKLSGSFLANFFRIFLYKPNISTRSTMNQRQEHPNINANRHKEVIIGSLTSTRLRQVPGVTNILDKEHCGAHVQNTLRVHVPPQ